MIGWILAVITSIAIWSGIVGILLLIGWMAEEFDYFFPILCLLAMFVLLVWVVANEIRPYF